jgi:hypothetical protein
MKRHGQFVNPSAISMPSGKEVEAAKFAEFQNVKQSHFAALELRFSKLPGLHIIDIESKASEEPVVHQISRVK